MVVQATFDLATALGRLAYIQPKAETPTPPKGCSVWRNGCLGKISRFYPQLGVKIPFRLRWPELRGLRTMGRWAGAPLLGKS